MRVLIVEDEPSIRTFLDIVLRGAGYDTVLAEDGADALDKEGSFDLLLTDVMMPRLNGVALASRMRQRDPDLPVLYVTAYSDRLFERKPVLWQREAFLDKPVTPDALLEGIDLLLRRRRAKAVWG
jgi:DNA-binding response OmpR family regulator